MPWSALAYDKHEGHGLSAKMSAGRQNRGLSPSRTLKRYQTARWSITALDLAVKSSLEAPYTSQVIRIPGLL
ncbi:hypothetical protein C0063_05575 [Pseudoxanthomonas sp. KAs_5_3]|nr:hypothetical protein C0063_05575 [Pseudoxanthomonas sp. KAs_5_3]